MVEVADYSGGVALQCHDCDWSANSDSGLGHPVKGEDYDNLRYEAAVLRHTHQSRRLT